MIDLNKIKDHPTDSGEYQILKRAVASVKGVKGIICELGVRQGGSSMHIIDALIENEDFDRVVIGVDCYGHIPYSSGLHKEKILFDYTNGMRNEALERLYGYLRGKPVNYMFFNLTDLDFFERFSGGVPVYDMERKFESSYAFAFLDAPHSFIDVANEIVFFAPRMPVGAYIVMDDILFPLMEYGKLEKILNLWGFELVEKGEKKASFKKVSVL